MKRKLSILTVLLMFLGSGGAWAQITSTAGDATQPYAGSTHSYWVNQGGASGTNQHQGNTYQWFITNAANIANQPGALPDGSDFTFPSGTYNTATADLSKISIAWKSAAMGKTYYLHVKEVNKSDGGCSNEKVIAILPMNNFILALRNVDSKGSDAVDQFSVCAPDVKPTLSGTTIGYDYGTNTLLYKITAQNISSDATWTFTYKITQGAGSSVTASFAGDVASVMSGTALTVDNNQHDQLVAAGTSAIYIAIKIDNNHLTNPEGISAQSYTFSLLKGADAENNAATIYDGVTNTAVSGQQDKVQIVNPRPATSSPISHD